MTPLRWTPALLAAGLAILPSTASAEYAPGKGSLGGTLGMPFLFATQELRAGQHPRIMGKAHFQYVFTPALRLSLRAGFGWFAYSGAELAPYPFPSDNVTQSAAVFDSTRVDQLTTVMPFSAALVYTGNLGGSGSWKWFGGAGLGVYRLNIMNDRRTVKDPETLEPLSSISPGINGELGVEYFLPSSKSVSFEGLATMHYLLETNGDKYPSGYSGRHGFADLSFGVNVYFSTGAGNVTPAAAPAEPKTQEEPAAETPEAAPVAPPPTPSPPTPSPYPNP